MTIQEEFAVLCKEARRRGMNYGRFVGATTEVERAEIVMRAARAEQARRKAPVAARQVTALPPSPPPVLAEGAAAILGLRKRLGLSQAEFAKAIGVAQATVCRWERGYPPEGWKELVKRMDTREM